MKKPSYLVICTLSVFIIQVTVSPSFGLTIDKVLASVDGEVVTLTDYQHFIEGLYGIRNTDSVDAKLLERLITDRIILHTAVRRGIEVTDLEVEKNVAAFREQNDLSQKDLEDVLSSQGMTMEVYKKRMADKLKSMKLFSLEVESKVIVTDKEIEDYYYDHKKDYLLSTEKVEITTILLKLKKDASVTEITELKSKALWMAAQLQKGGSFESIINHPNVLKGFVEFESVSGQFERGSLNPELDDKAFSMQIGETSEPIWVPKGAYILKLINRTDENFKSIRDVHEEIYRHLFEKKREIIFNEFVRSLWETKSVKIY